MDAVMLDSLSIYGTTTGGTNAATTATSTLSPLMADVAFSTTATVPVLGLFLGPRFYAFSGGSPGPALPLANFQLATEAGTLATGHEASDIADDTIMLAGLGSLSSGTHSLKTSWASTKGAQLKATSRADVITFSPAAHTASASLSSDQSTSSSSLVTIPSLGVLTLSPTVATQALVFLQMDGAPGSAADAGGGEFAIALDNTPVGGGVAVHEYKGGSRPMTLVQLVNMSAGSHTLQAQFKARASTLHTGGSAAFSAVLIE